MTPEFPPHSWLGNGLDLTAITPCDIKSVTNQVLRAFPLLDLSSTNPATPTTINGVTWAVPDGVNVASGDVSGGESSFSSFQDGSSVTTALQADASLSAKYMALTLDASTSYSVNKTFNNKNQYAMFAFNQTQLVVSLEDFGDKLRTNFLKSQMSKHGKFTLQPEDSPEAQVAKAAKLANKTLVDGYRSIFKVLGSHIITGATYGARLQLNVWASNSDSSIDTNFSADVSAAYNGLTASGNFDASIKTQDEYKAFSNSLQKLCSCIGGDDTLATKIDSDPADSAVWANYQNWIPTVKANPAVTTFQTQALWDIMSFSSDNDVSGRAEDIQKAYDWICENPEDHFTKCRLTINSDWGEIGLLTPSATIVEDKDLPYNRDNTYFGRTKITWGREHSFAFQRDYTIDFIIQNDGSPVDIELSHGSDGDSSGNGNINANIFGANYLNSGTRGNNWNTQWFFSCPVLPSVHVDV